MYKQVKRVNGEIIFEYKNDIQLKINIEKYVDELYDADLSGLNLRRCNLQNANLSKANLKGANLQETDLTNAILIDADVSGANLNGACLYGANMLCVKFDDDTIFSNIKLSNTKGICRIECEDIYAIAINCGDNYLSKIIPADNFWAKEAIEIYARINWHIN